MGKGGKAGGGGGKAGGGGGKAGGGGGKAGGGGVAALLAVVKVAFVLVAAVAVLAVLVEKGVVQPSIPYPAVAARVHTYPKDVFPWVARPDEGDFTPNGRLKAVRLFEGQVVGSESVVIAPDGTAVMLDKWGAVFEASEQPDGSFKLNPTPRAWLGPGRPLGAAFDAQGNLYICDAFKGILLLEAGTNEVVIVSNRVAESSPLEPGSPIIYANDLDVAPDGRVYFTTSIDIYPHRNAPADSRFEDVPSLEGRPGFFDTVKGWGLGMCQGLPKGKLYRYDPATRETHLLVTGFYYSNGVAVAADNSFVVVSETDRLRLLKYYLTGPKANTTEVMIDHLPGTPDGVTRAPDGAFWTSLLAKVPAFTKRFDSPIIRSLLPVIQEKWRPYPYEWGAVVKVDGDGNVVDFLEDPQRPDPRDKPSAYRISSAHEHNGRLWLGALVAPFVSYVDLTTLPPRPPPIPTTWRPPVNCTTPPCAYVRGRFY